jgi:hypothetical protein
MSWNSQGLSRPVMGLLYFYLTYYTELSAPRNVPLTLNCCGSSPNIVFRRTPWSRIPYTCSKNTHFLTCSTKTSYVISVSKIVIFNLLALTVAVRFRPKHQFAEWCVMKVKRREMNKTGNGRTKLHGGKLGILRAFQPEIIYILRNESLKQTFNWSEK